jgi:hypothetical protein
VASRFRLRHSRALNRFFSNRRNFCSVSGAPFLSIRDIVDVVVVVVVVEAELTTSAGEELEDDDGNNIVDEWDGGATTTIGGAVMEKDDDDDKDADGRFPFSLVMLWCWW